MYGLRSSPKAWQDHLASIMRELGYIRLTSEPNVYKHPEEKAYIMVYVADLLFVGETEEINTIFNKIQEKMLLRATGEASPGNTISFLGRKITNKGDHFDISLDDEYVDNIFHEMKLSKCNPVATTGTTAGKSNIEDEQLLDQQDISNFDDLSESYNGWHTPDQTSAMQQKNLQEHFNNQPSKTRRSCDIWSGILQVQKITNSASDQQSSCMTTHHSNWTWTSMLTRTGQDVIKQDEAQQALSSNYSALASTLDLEHKQW